MESNTSFHSIFNLQSSVFGLHSSFIFLCALALRLLCIFTHFKLKLKLKFNWNVQKREFLCDHRYPRSVQFVTSGFNFSLISIALSLSPLYYNNTRTSMIITMRNPTNSETNPHSLYILRPLIPSFVPPTPWKKMETSTEQKVFHQDATEDTRLENLGYQPGMQTINPTLKWLLFTITHHELANAKIIALRIPLTTNLQTYIYQQHKIKDKKLTMSIHRTSTLLWPAWHDRIFLFHSNMVHFPPSIYSNEQTHINAPRIVGVHWEVYSSQESTQEVRQSWYGAG